MFYPAQRGRVQAKAAWSTPGSRMGRPVRAFPGEGGPTLAEDSRTLPPLEYLPDEEDWRVDEFWTAMTAYLRQMYLPDEG